MFHPLHLPPSSTKAKVSTWFLCYGAQISSWSLRCCTYSTLPRLPGTASWLTPTSLSSTSISILTRGPFTYTAATEHCSFILMNQDAYSTHTLKGKPEPHCSALNHLFLPPALAKLRFSKHQSTVLISEMLYLLFMAGDRISEPETKSVLFLFTDVITYICSKYLFWTGWWRNRTRQ